MSGFLSDIGTGVTSAITYLGNVVSALFTENGALSPILPAIGLAVGVTLIGWGIGKVKSLIVGY